MKSWIELSEEEQEKYINDFKNKYTGISGELLHKINKFYLIIIIPLALFVILRIICETDEDIVAFKYSLGLFIVLYILNLIGILKEDSAFKKWLKTKNILK